MLDDHFVGSWKLITSRVRIEDNKEYELPPGVKGTLMIDTEHNMSVQFVFSDRFDFILGELPKILFENIGSIFSRLLLFPLQDPRKYLNSLSQFLIRFPIQGYGGYFGTCRVDEEKETLTTDVEGSVIQEWAGMEFTRHFKFSDDYQEMLLEALPMEFLGLEVTLTANWKKVGDSVRKLESKKVSNQEVKEVNQTKKKTTTVNKKPDTTKKAEKTETTKKTEKTETTKKTEKTDTTKKAEKMENKKTTSKIKKESPTKKAEKKEKATKSE